MCEGEITRVELLAALKETGNNKSPGIDGIPADFYKMFWNELGNHMLETINYIYHKGEMSVNHRKGVISLIPKKDRDTTFLKNWRPITLLCSDYKLISKVIANRLKKHLPKLVNADQCGFVQNRYIGQNVDLLIQILEYCNTNHVPGIILSVDYQKAFDQLSWKFIEDVLCKYGFGNMFVKWIKLFYTNITSVVNVNGHFTKPIPIEKGVKQGDPISPYVFILCAEILAEYVRNNENIKGITVGSVEYKISMFADDTNMFIEYNKISLDNVLLALDNFASVSGLRINYEKSTAYCVGMGVRKELDARYPITWGLNRIETLGVKIPLQKNIDILSLNYESKIADIESVIKSWNTRNLSLRGKVIVIKALLLSKLQYLISVIGPPRQGTIHRLNKIIYRFLWNGTEKLKRSVLIKPLEEGGLNMPDFETICKCALIKWVHRYIHAGKSNWKSIVDHSLKELGSTYLFRCNLSYDDSIVKLIKSPLWRKIVKAWCELNFEKRKKVLQADVVWLNSNFSQTIYDRESVEKGLSTVKQFFDGNKMITIEEIYNKYGVQLNFIYYHIIVTNIKSMYTGYEEFEQAETRSIINRIYDRPKDKLLSKNIYIHFIGRKERCENVKHKWKPIEINDDNTTLFSHIERCTIVNKLRSFQFKLLHKVLFFNDKLFKYKIINSSLCDFCNERIDSIEHRFLYCRVTQGFFHEMNLWIRKYIKTNYDFQKPYCMITNICKDLPVLETILLNAKYYIYTCYIQKKLPNIGVFKCKVEELEKIERAIAEDRNTVFIHDMKWNRLK